MRALRLIGLLSLVLTAHGAVKAQSDLLFSNSMRSVEVYNPAMIENNGMINATLMNRQQWVGFPDAPKATQFGLGYFFDLHSMGLKLNVISQTTGKEVTRNLMLAYSYKVHFNEKVQLNFGVGAGLNQRQILYSQLIYLQGDEPLQRPDENYFRPDFEFGVHFTTPEFSMGYAANHLTNINRDPSLSRVPLHHHFYGTYNFPILDRYSLRTGASFHQQGKVGYFQLDAQAFFGDLQFGLGWRHLDAMIVKAGIKVMENLDVSYSYDLGINRLSNFNSGSHEVMLVLRIEPPRLTYLSPRFLDY